MQAVVNDRYGPPDVLEIRSVAVPAPGAGEVLVEVAAAALNPLDWHFTTGRPYFLRLIAGRRRPKQATRGADVAGRVAALGDGVTGFAVGERVAGIASGSFAQFATANVSRVAVVPAGLADHEAAAVPLAGVTALQALRDHGDVAAGQRVLVIGAAGGVGVYAVQLAVAMGAAVTGVCSGRNVDLVRSLGAADVIDYETAGWADRSGFDVIIDTVGNSPLGECRRALVDGGRYVMVGAPKANPWLDPIGRIVAGKLRFAFRSQRIRQFTATITAEDVRVLYGYVDAGQVRAVVSRRIALADVPAATADIGAGHTRGKVVVDMRAGVDPGATA